MQTNLGHHNNILDSHKRFRRFTTESTGLGIAEIVSSVASLGIIGLADDIAPGFMKATTGFVDKKIVQPNLDVMEHLIERLCKIEECQIDRTQTREERSKRLANTLVKFGVAWVPSMAVKLATRRYINELSGINNDKNKWYNLWAGLKDSAHDGPILFADEGIHIGSMYILSATDKGSEISSEMIKGSKNLLQAFGLSEKQAHEVAVMGVVHEIPNLIGLAGGVGMIYKQVYHSEKFSTKVLKNHVEKLVNGKGPTLDYTPSM